MGLFNQTKTTVATSVARVVSDEQMPNAILEGVTKYLTADEGDDQFTEQVMESMVNSIGYRAYRMFNYGRDNYIYGLPSGSVYSSFAGKEASEAVLETETGGLVSIIYYHFGPLNNIHVGWKKLTEEFGYDYLTNKINSLSTLDVPVYLKDMQLFVVEATLEESSNGSLVQWGTPPNAGYTPQKKYMNPTAGGLQGATPFAVDSVAAHDYILVSTCWEELEPISPGSTHLYPVVKYGSFTIPLINLNMVSDYHQAKYLDHNGNTNYWIYKVGDGHAALDAVFNAAYSGTGHFFPWLYLRYNKTSMTDDKTSEDYKSSKRLAHTLNMDFDQLVDAVHENPGIIDVEQAMMIMAVPADTDNPIEQRYLFDFFSGLYEKVKLEPNSATNTQNYAIMSGLNLPMSMSSIIIQDRRFKMALNWRDIVKRKVAGTIGPVGTYLSGANSIPSDVDVPSLGGGAVTWNTTYKRHWYQYQVAVGVYEEIQLIGLNMVYYIFGEYTTTGDEDDDILLIPIDISITKSYNLTDREILYSRGLHYVFNSHVITHLQWYQTSTFKTILVVIAIVITVLSYGSTWQTIGLALAAGTISITAVLIILIEQLIQYLIMQYLFKLFVKKLGAKFAFIVAIIAMVVGTSMGINAGSVKGAPWASELLSVASGLTKAITNSMSEDFQDLLSDQSDFQKYMKEQTKLLNTTKDLLNHNDWLAPLVVFGETPHDFFQRTSHSGNIGAIGIDAVESFVAVSLSLPKLSDTIS